jgi:hypothetical protein
MIVGENVESKCHHTQPEIVEDRDPKGPTGRAALSTFDAWRTISQNEVVRSSI